MSTEIEKKPATTRKPKKKARKSVPHGVVYIRSSFNNTIVTVTDPVGNTLSWASSGERGFKGSRKGTPFAAQLAAEEAVRRAMEHGIRSVKVIVSGPGAGRESAVRILSKTGVKVTSIRDMTSIAHNGCRPKKRRRV